MFTNLQQLTRYASQRSLARFDDEGERGVKSIAIFDYRVLSTNPVGSCHRRMLAALSSEYDCTVFAVEFDNPSPQRIAFQRIPVPRRPLALLFVTYHLMAPVCYWIYRLRYRRHFDMVQMVESNLSFGTVAYTHFCHRAYLRLRSIPFNCWSVRQWFRWIDHRLRAALEPAIYKRVKHIVVPSQGIASEIAREHPGACGKVRVIYNPVDIEWMRRPAGFDPEVPRREAGWSVDDLVLIFVALGHFERKGLPIILEALRRTAEPRLKLLVVGGERGLVKEYEAWSRRNKLEGRVAFTGHRQDARPYLWSADAFVFPSHYETFSLAAVEAAAASLPVVAPLLYGIEEWLRDGENGLVITQTAESVAAALEQLLDLDQGAVKAMGARAADDVRRFGLGSYALRWCQFYGTLQKNGHDHLA